ncbi:hypothetical protein [Streptomyces umbrinus]|uniref:hypothetical protein n=1 Tax=Streptomyces umbrinus TaxID=67370 RepID=UPI003C30C4F1
MKTGTRTFLMAAIIATLALVAAPSATAAPATYAGETLVEGDYGSVTYDYGRITGTDLYWVKLTGPLAFDYGGDSGTVVWTLYTDANGRTQTRDLVEVGPAESKYGGDWSATRVKDLRLYVSETDGTLVYNGVRLHKILR